MTILIFFIILAVLILAHELGHFLAAKKFGVKVEEFGLGFPPRLWSIKKGETLYSINWIPFGGFVKILGETASEGDQKDIPAEDKGRSLTERSRLTQAIVLVAGVAFNILLAWLIFSFSLWIGMPTARGNAPVGQQLESAQLYIVEVIKDSPADRAGLSGGDIITNISAGQEQIDTPTITEIQKFIAERGGEPINLEYVNPVEGKKDVQLVPESGLSDGKAAIGISMEEIGILKLPFFQSIWHGLKLALSVTWAIILALRDLFAGLFQGETAILSSVTGPVGLVGVIDSSLTLGVSYLLNLVAVISLNLAVINLLPIPALDGGRILFLGIEAIRRRALSPKFVNAVNSAGFFLLLALMAVLTYRDIWRLFK